MNERCTCGALTVEGARFCHKCGRPLYEEPKIEPEAALEPQESVPPPASAPPAPAEINFRNSVAVRVGFLMAGLGIFATNLLGLLGSPILQAISVLTLAAGSGYFAVWLYNRRTGQRLSVTGGARLGWITGVFSFLIVMVIVTMTVALVGPEAYSQMLRDNIVKAAASQPNLKVPPVEQLMGTMIFMILITAFATFTVAASIGGAFGAKILHKSN
ncbi:MAG: hypothetical protein SFV18_08920 [Bryobacteraceae bacterium]|nr:hypothetical protein [Bryobacteraceae bacterium]